MKNQETDKLDSKVVLDIPEKFRGSDGGLNADALLKSYSELEKKIGGMISVPGESSDAESLQKFYRAIGVPDDVNEYPTHDLFDIDIKNELKSMGITKDQAIALQNMAEKYLMPAIESVQNTARESEEILNLKNFFGDSDKMSRALQEIESFGEKFLPRESYESLCGSADGIRAIYSMMNAFEPKIASGANAAEILNDSALRDMMRDPKYWRDRDPEYVRKVESGFKKLYAE